MDQKLIPRGEIPIHVNPMYKMGISCNQYVILYSIWHLRSMKKPVNKEEVFKKTGLPIKFIEKEIKGLYQDDFVEKIDGKIYTTDKFNWHLDTSIDLENEFNKFWYIVEDNKNKVAWPGPKAQAKKKFALARKKYSFEDIMKARENYFNYLSIAAWRKKMVATKFLNVENGYIDHDWSNERDMEVEKNKKDSGQVETTQSTYSIEDHKKTVND